METASSEGDDSDLSSDIESLVDSVSEKCSWDPGKCDFADDRRAATRAARVMDSVEKWKRRKRQEARKKKKAEEEEREMKEEADKWAEQEEIERKEMARNAYVMWQKKLAEKEAKLDSPKSRRIRRKWMEFYQQQEEERKAEERQAACSEFFKIWVNARDQQKSQQ